MYTNYTFANVDDALPFLCSEAGVWPEVNSRNGRTRETTFIGVTLEDPLSREILGEHRKANIAAQIAETMWVLGGRNDMEFLSAYLPRARDFSDDGKTWRGAYGTRLRDWAGEIDQLEWVVRKLTEDPDTRQAVIQIYDPALDDYVHSKDIPCNNWITFLHRNGVLDMQVGIRSNDLIWGWSGINQFEWSVLLEVVARLAGMTVGSLHFDIQSLHVYEPHWAKASRIAKDRTDFNEVADSPRFQPPFGWNGLSRFDQLVTEWFRIEEEIRTKGVPVEVQSRIDVFPEPMLQSWLRVLAWWWTGDRGHLIKLGGTRLAWATRVGVQPDRKTDDTERPAPVLDTTSVFCKAVQHLHAEKTAAYGDSWRSRGELFSIMPNIARKVDRLGRAGAGDSEADTLIDLSVYLAKYLIWLQDGVGEDIDTLLYLVDRDTQGQEPGFRNPLYQLMRDQFELLLMDVEQKASTDIRANRAKALLYVAWPLARKEWLRERSNDYLLHEGDDPETDTRPIVMDVNAFGPTPEGYVTQ